MDPQGGLGLREMQHVDAVGVHRSRRLSGVESALVHLGDVRHQVGFDAAGLPQRVGQTAEHLLVRHGREIRCSPHGQSVGRLPVTPGPFVVVRFSIRIDAAVGLWELYSAPTASVQKGGLMELSAGTRLGPYEILAPLGAGGMGEVYRTTDTKLGRDVAIKVLPAEMTGDAERLARIQREAHLLASLNHPHIAAIHGLEEADGHPFLVLELVEGEDLKERLERGAIPVDEAFEIAEQVGEALEEAQSKGIVHRDLKPANVKVTPDGTVKVLDFGLAKAWAGEPVEGTASSGSMSQSPTLAHSDTQAGVILGTAAHMSPEQARGKAVDKRSDVWAFGVLLWEMLTGRVLFADYTVTDISAAVVKEELDLEALPAGTPRAVLRLIARRLRKDPRTRLHDIGGARLELQDVLAGPSSRLASSAFPLSTSCGPDWRARSLLEPGRGVVAVFRKEPSPVPECRADPGRSLRQSHCLPGRRSPPPGLLHCRVEPVGDFEAMARAQHPFRPEPPSAAQSLT
jgi:serine/threonine protein kinase